jgi:hypothetical protein
MTLVSVDSTAFPETVTTDSAWVISGGQVWGAIPVEEQPRVDGASSVRAMLREGPKWTPGATVVVVVRLRNREGHATCVRTPPQQIARTD